jgi:hypothetical protein
MHLFLVFFQWLVFQIIASRAQQTALITDLPAFSALATCATVAIQSAFGSINNDCPTNAVPTVSASCACLKNQNSAFLSAQISSQVTWPDRCGATATDDVTSALNVFSAYCAVAQPITPTVQTITQIVYLTDFPALNSLAPCAIAAVQSAFGSINNDCPANAVPTLSASCACLKGQNSAFLSAQISSQVTWPDRCGPTGTEDLTSALAVLSAYCAPFGAAGPGTSKYVPSTTHFTANFSSRPAFDPPHSCRILWFEYVPVALGRYVHDSASLTNGS